MGNTFFENKRKQQLENKIAKLEARSRHTHTYILTLLKDMEESEKKLSQPLSEKEADYWERRRDNCQARVVSNTEKANNLEKRITALKADLAQL